MHALAVVFYINIVLYLLSKEMDYIYPSLAEFHNDYKTVGPSLSKYILNLIKASSGTGHVSRESLIINFSDNTNTDKGDHSLKFGVHNYNRVDLKSINLSKPIEGRFTWGWACPYVCLALLKHGPWPRV